MKEMTAKEQYICDEELQSYTDLLNAVAILVRYNRDAGVVNGATQRLEHAYKVWREARGV